jgi:hypothetical protein
MAYSNFNLSGVIKQFGLRLNDKHDLFAHVPEIPISDYLHTTLNYNLPIASEINTEKSRSEMLISPILLEVRRYLNDRISLFSGREFNVESEQGLNGICDFLISLSDSQLVITAPVVVIIEAKKEDIIGGLGQCIAAMVGAQQFNQQEHNSLETIYGAVTSGTAWRFLKLEQTTAFVDRVEYYINQVDKILGILASTVS